MMMNPTSLFLPLRDFHCRIIVKIETNVMVLSHNSRLKKAISLSSSSIFTPMGKYRTVLLIQLSTSWRTRTGYLQINPLINILSIFIEEFIYLYQGHSLVILQGKDHRKSA